MADVRSLRGRLKTGAGLEPLIARSAGGAPTGLIDPLTGREVDSGLFISLAQLLDPIINDAVTRDANGAASSAALVWPDGATGTYTATQVSAAFPGAVDAYTCTRVVGGVTTTYTQPAVTRDASGAVVNKPAIVVS